MTESAPGAEVKTQPKIYSIKEIPEGLQGGLKLPERTTLQITKPGSEKRALFYGGPGVEINSDTLRELMKTAGCQLRVSIGGNIPEEEAGKARLSEGQESPDKPPSPALPIEEALDLFKRALEQEKANLQSASTAKVAKVSTQSPTGEEKKEPTWEEQVEEEAKKIHKLRINDLRGVDNFSDSVLTDCGVIPGTPEADRILREIDLFQAKRQIKEREIMKEWFKRRDVGETVSLREVQQKAGLDEFNNKIVEEWVEWIWPYYYKRWFTKIKPPGEQERQRKELIDAMLSSSTGKPEDVPAQTTESGDVEIQAPSKSEGKKWAEILRKEGIGCLHGEFWRSWTFIDPQGIEQPVSDREIDWMAGGFFGDVEVTFVHTIAGMNEDRFRQYYGMWVNDRYRFPQALKEGRIFNSLIIGNIDREARDKYEGWKLFRYNVYLSNAPDMRGGTIQLEFIFALSPIRASELISKVEKKADLIEDLFQNVYPGLTQKGKAERVRVKELALVNTTIDKGRVILKKLSFSAPVGEADTIPPNYRSVH